MFGESVFASVVANYIFSTINHNVAKLKDPIRQHVPADFEPDRRILNAISKSISYGFEKNITSDNRLNSKTLNFIKMNIKTITKYFVDFLVFDRDQAKLEIRFFVTNGLDVATKSAEYNSISMKLNKLIEDIEERFSTLTKGTNVHISRQVRRLSSSIDETNRFIERFFSGVKDKRSQGDLEFQKKYISFSIDYANTFRHFGFPSHMRPKQTMEVAYVPITFFSSNNSDGNLLNSLSRHTADSTQFDLNSSNLLSDLPFLAVVGGAGCGKTSLLQWLTLNYCRAAHGENSIVPILVPLRRIHEFSESGAISIDRLINMSVDKDRFTAKAPDGFERRLFESKRCALLLDGVDELAPELRSEFWQSILELIEKYPGNKVVITSRPLAGVHQGDGQRILRNTADMKASRSIIANNWKIPEHTFEVIVKKMSAPQIASFVTAWHKSLDIKALRAQNIDNTPSVYGKNLIDRLTTDERELIEFCETPLLCSMLCALHFYNDGALPDDKPQLFRECISILVSTRDSQRKIKYHAVLDSINEESRIALIQRIALNMQASFYDGTRSTVRLEVSKEKVISWISDIKKNVLDWNVCNSVTDLELYKYIIERFSVLREPVSGQVDFLHRSFLEYLTASAWPVSGRDARELASKVNNDQWHDTLRFSSNTPTGGSLFATQLLHELVSLCDEMKSQELKETTFSLCCEIFSYMKERSDEAISSLSKIAQWSLPITPNNFRDYSRVDYSVVRELINKDNFRSTPVKNRVYLAKLASINNDIQLMRKYFKRSSDENIMMLCNWAGVHISEHPPLIKKIAEKSLSQTYLNKIFAYELNDLEFLVDQSEISIAAELLHDVEESIEERIDFDDAYQRVNVIFRNTNGPSIEGSLSCLNVPDVAIYGIEVCASDINNMFIRTKRLTFVGLRNVNMDTDDISIFAMEIKLRDCSLSVEGLLSRIFPKVNITVDRKKLPVLPYS